MILIPGYNILSAKGRVNSFYILVLVLIGKMKELLTVLLIVTITNNVMLLSGNCSVTPITPDYSDAARLDGRRVRIKHAKELLQVNPSQFVFSGKVLDAKSKQYLQPLETNLLIL